MESQAVYKSSRVTYFYKYVFVPLWAGWFILAIISTWNQPDVHAQQFTRTATVMVAYALLWLIPFAVRLKHVEATGENIVAKTLAGKWTIPYRDIDWAYEIALVNPQLISVKLKNGHAYPFSRLLIIPAATLCWNLVRWFKPTEMTEFIVDNIKKAKPPGKVSKPPSRYRVAFLLFASSIPVVIFLVQFVDGVK